MTKRVLQTGSRGLTVDRFGAAATVFVRDTLALVWHPDAVLVTGDCDRGADQLAIACWHAWGGHVETHPADWAAPCRPSCRPGHRYHRANGTVYCPAAGAYRNQHMVDLGADICVALFAAAPTAGTAHCVRAARTAGIPIITRTRTLTHTVPQRAEAS